MTMVIGKTGGEIRNELFEDICMVFKGKQRC